MAKPSSSLSSAGLKKINDALEILAAAGIDLSGLTSLGASIDSRSPSLR